MSLSSEQRPEFCAPGYYRNRVRIDRSDRVHRTARSAGNAPASMPAGIRARLPARASLGADAGSVGTVAHRFLLTLFFLLTTSAELFRVHHADALYAEDGKNFVGDWLTRPSIWLLFSPYDGYQQFIPRVVSALAVMTSGVASWGTAVTVLNCATVGGICTMILLLGRDVVSFWPARFLLALIPVFCPLAGFEAVGNSNNLHWYLTYLMLWILLGRPRSRAGQWLLTFAALAATLTETQCVAFAPLVWWVWRQDRRRPSETLSRIGILGGWACGALVQGITYMAEPGRDRGGRFDSWWRAVKGYVVEAVSTDFYPTGRRLPPMVQSYGFWFGVIVGVLILGAAVAASRLGPPAVRAAAVTAVWVSVLSWFVSYYINTHRRFTVVFADPFHRSVPAARWGTAAAMLLAAVIPLAVDSLIRRRPRWRMVGSGLLLTVALTLIATSSAGQLHADRSRSWSGAVAHGARECRAHPTTNIKIAINPDTWFVSMPCRRLLS